MRARLALASSGIKVALREVVLRDKPAAMLAASPKGTVPVLVPTDGDIVEESLDIMFWALERNDPEDLLAMPQPALELIEECDTAFKPILDRYKYAPDGTDPAEERTKARVFLSKLEAQLDGRPWLFDDAPRLADFAILPFVRQFAHVDLDWFLGQDWPNLQRWLQSFKTSERFLGVMRKYPQWTPGDPVTIFPSGA